MGIGRISIPELGWILCSGTGWISILKLVRGRGCLFGSGLKARVFYHWPFLSYSEPFLCSCWNIDRLEPT